MSSKCRYPDCPNAITTAICSCPWTQYEDKAGGWNRHSCQCEITCNLCRSRLGWTSFEEQQLLSQKIQRYHQLEKSDPVELLEFLDQNKHDARLMAIIDMHQRIVPAFKKAGREYLDDINAALAEDDPTIQKAMLDSVIMGSVVELVNQLLEEKDDPK